MISITNVLKHYSKDLSLPAISSADLKTLRSSAYRAAFAGDSSLTPSEVRLFEICCKSYNDSELPPPQSSVDTFISTQLNEPEIHLRGDEIRLFRRIFCCIFGSAPTLKDLSLIARHGPGVTSDKFIGVDKWLGCLSDESVFSSYCDPLGRLPRVIERYSSKYYDVPKTAWVNRGIAAEPTWLQFIQQSIGRVMVTRLYPFVTISTQTSNQNMASQPWFDTLDLSAASDSIRMQHLDIGLLPDDWSDLLSRYRSIWCSVDNSVIRLNSVASMGNGFCFALLSAFCTVASLTAMSRHRGERFPSLASLRRDYSSLISVFGDDIVVHRDYSNVVKSLLARLGFSVNFEKSSSSDVFKETCGAFYSNGKRISDIVRLKNLDLSSAASVQSLCNAQRRLYLQGSARTANYLKKEICSSIYAQCVSLFNPYSFPFDWDFDSTYVLYDSVSDCKVRQHFRLHKPYVKVYGYRSLERPYHLSGGSAFALSLYDDEVKEIPSSFADGDRIARVFRYPLALRD